MSQEVPDTQPSEPNQLPPGWRKLANGVIYRPAQQEEITEERRQRSSLPSDQLMRYMNTFGQLGEENFDLLHQLSVTSNVPVTFPEANRKIAGDMIAEILSTRKSRPARENAYRLLDRMFSTDTEANYAIWYCQSMAVFKAYDQAPEKEPEVLDRYATASQMGKRGLERWAEKCASEVGVLEAGIQQPSGPPTLGRKIRQMMGEIVRRHYFKGKFQEVREYCEDYFATEQHRSRIFILAQP